MLCYCDVFFFVFFAKLALWLSGGHDDPKIHQQLTDGLPRVILRNTHSLQRMNSTHICAPLRSAAFISLCENPPSLLIAKEFGKDVQVPIRMNCNDLADSIIFH